MYFLKDADLKNKRVLLRTDFNVPLSPNGEILDDSRIKAAIPTIKYILGQNPQELIILSHIGRPVIRPNENIETIINGNKLLRMESVIKRLISLLEIKTKEIEVEESSNLRLSIYHLAEKIKVIENLRFDIREEKADESFARQLADQGEVFVNDAFSMCHRRHASIVILPKLLPSYAGLQLEKEIQNLSPLLLKPPKPFVLILGGAKVKDKILTLNNFFKKIDYCLLGGVMANTFLKARNFDIKKSVVEKERLSLASELFEKAPQKFILPNDFSWEREKIVDIGPATIRQFETFIAKAKTIFWNGPIGLTSGGLDRYFAGSNAVARAIAANKNALSIVSGGDTAEIIDRLKLRNEISFLSTGGGATLEFLTFGNLPGLEALGFNMKNMQHESF